MTEVCQTPGCGHFRLAHDLDGCRPDQTKCPCTAFQPAPPVTQHGQDAEAAATAEWERLRAEFYDPSTESHSLTDKHLFIPAFIAGYERGRGDCGR